MLRCRAARCGHYSCIRAAWQLGYHWHLRCSAAGLTTTGIPALQLAKRTSARSLGPRIIPCLDSYIPTTKNCSNVSSTLSRDMKSYQILQIICRAAAGAPTQGLIRGQECVHTAPSVFYPESNEHTSSTVRPSSSMSTAPASLLSDDPFCKRIDLCANPSHDDTNPNTCSFRYRGSASSTRHAPGDVEKTPM